MAWLAQIMHHVMCEVNYCLCKEVTMKRNVLLPSIITLALLASTPQLFATEAQDREGHQRPRASQSSAKRRSDVQNRQRLPRTQPQSSYPTRKHLRRRGFQRPYWHGRRHRPIIAPRYFYPRIYRPLRIWVATSPWHPLPQGTLLLRPGA